MKTNKIFMSLIAILISAMVFSADAKKQSNKAKVLFDVSMDCASCKAKIEKNIAFEKGVRDLVVNLEKKTVLVTYDLSNTTVENLQAGFKKIGYEATVIPENENSIK